MTDELLPDSSKFSDVVRVIDPIKAWGKHGILSADSFNRTAQIVLTSEEGSHAEKITESLA